MSTEATAIAADVAEAKRFLDLLDAAPQARFTFQTFDDSGEKREGLTRVLHGTFDQHAAKLDRLNERGAGIFVTVNKTDLLGRAARNVIEVRALFIDLDHDGRNALKRVAKILCNTAKPSIVVASSPDRFHVYWLIDECPLVAFREAQKQLSTLFASDPSINDLPRVMRLPGFMHTKNPHDRRVVRLVLPTACTFTTPHYEFRHLCTALGFAQSAQPLAVDGSARDVNLQYGVPVTKSPETPGEIERVRSMLSAIPIDQWDDRQLWFQIGAALHWTEWTCAGALWDEYSKQSKKFDEAD